VCDIAEYIHLSRDKAQWQIIVHKVTRKISFSANVGNFLDLRDVSNYKLLRKVSIQGG
jgi:hypothetical protein